MMNNPLMLPVTNFVWLIALYLMAGLLYGALGLLVLSLIEAFDERTQQVSDEIDGWRAFVALLLWPLTAIYLLWQARRRRHA